MLNQSNQVVRLGALCLAASICFLGCPSACGQDAEKDETTQVASDSATVTLAEVKKTLEQVESDSALDASVKDVLRLSYKQAIEDLQSAEEFSGKANEFAGSLENAHTAAEEKRSELASLPTEQEAASVNKFFDETIDLQREISARNAELQKFTQELTKAKEALTQLRDQRPAEISERIPAATAELEATQKQLKTPDVKNADSAGRRSKRTALLAKETKLLAEIEMLGQEQKSLEVRQDLLEAQTELLNQRVVNSKAAIGTLKRRETNRVKEEVGEIEAILLSTKQTLPEGDTGAQKLHAEVSELFDQANQVLADSTNINAAQAEIDARLVKLKDESDDLTRDLKLEGAGRFMAQRAFDLQDKLLDPSAYAVETDANDPSPDSLRLASIGVSEKLRNQDLIADEFSGRNSKDIDQLIEARKELLLQLNEQYKRIVPAIFALDSKRKQLKAEGSRVREEISEQLVWVRSSAPVKLKDFKDFPSGLAWVFSAEHWREFCGALEATFNVAPIRFIGAIAIVIVLLVLRPRTIKAIEDSGQLTRRISIDRFGHSCKALALTVVLSLPIAILLWFLGWAMAQAPEPSAWMRGLTVAMPSASRIMFLLAFAVELCRPGGLGNVHFVWRQPTLDAIRRTIFRFGIVYIPAGLIVSSTLYGDASQYSDGVGRISLMLSKLWSCFLIWQLFGGKNGIINSLVDKQPQRYLTRTRIGWYPLLLAAPLIFLGLAARGYVIASIELSRGFAQTIGVILVAETAYWMALRWFSIKARHLAVTERMERLRAAKEAAVASDTDDSNEVISISTDEQESLDLATIGLQTRRMVRSLISVAAVIAVASLWSSSFPVSSILSEIRVPFTGDIDLFELTQAVVIFWIASVIIKNLPGVLELTVFRGSSIDNGTRYAITTLLRYGFGAIGIAIIFNVLNFDWTKFAWMAAALSLGLGFGLQEVITNFVCGVILLFERPVRVGDVVTIQGVTGTVTRIRMRATTITNWDRQEFVVPNKNLITDTILNWTLSASVSRIVVNIGVAYGSNTAEARQILLDVASEHPVVMKDPQPMATFEQFADSSLNLVLRCYVPDLDNRLKTISELHTEIDHRFTEAGIEIAFPQQDIHIRTGLDQASDADRREAAESGFGS